MGSKWFTLHRFVDSLWPGPGRGATTVLAIRLAFVGLEFLSSLVLARLFMASAYGTYAFAIAVVGVLAVPACLGFDRLLIREVAAFQSQRAWGLLRGILRRTSQLVFVVSTIIASAGIAVTHFLAENLGHELTTALQTGMLLVPIYALARVRLAALQGLGHVTAGQVPEMLLQPVALLIFALISYQLLPAMHGGAHLVGLQLVAALLTGAAGIILWLRRRPRLIAETTPVYRTREWMAASMPLVAVLACGLALTSLDTILVGSQLGPVAAGVYRVSSQMAMLVGFPLTAVNMVAAPRIATFFAMGDARGMQRVASGCTRQVLVLALPASIAVISLGRPALQLFGPEFPDGYAALVILSFAYLAISSAGIAGYVLIMTGHEKPTAIVFSIAMIANIAGNLALVPRFGLEGAAASTAVCLLGLAIGLAALCRSRLMVDPMAFWRRDIPESS